MEAPIGALWWVTWLGAMALGVALVALLLHLAASGDLRK